MDIFDSGILFIYCPLEMQREDDLETYGVQIDQSSNQIHISRDIGEILET